MNNQWQWHKCMPSGTVRPYPTLICNNCRGELGGSINFTPTEEEYDKHELEQDMIIIDSILEDKKHYLRRSKFSIYIME